MKAFLKSFVFVFCFSVLMAFDMGGANRKLSFAIDLPVSSGELFVIIGVTGAVAALLIIGIVVFMLLERKINKELESAGYEEESKGQRKEQKRVIGELKQYEKDQVKLAAEQEKAEKKAPVFYDNTVIEAAPEEDALKASEGGEFDFDMGQPEQNEEPVAPILDSSEFDIDFSEEVDEAETETEITEE